MLLRYSFDLEEDATLIENAVRKVLGTGMRTADIMGPGAARISTTVMGDAILRQLDMQAA